ncbi:MAG: hypothetical protein JW747_00945 [Candidatus Aminicenantes bacterium]|nr:hypothetical protein [Candidatus Aminicenantes bacterium]
MKNIFVLLALVPGLMSPLSPQSGKNLTYHVQQAYLTDDRGQVLSQQPSAGMIVLSADGTYKASLLVQDEGTWRMVKASPQQPRDTIVFTSKNAFQFFGYPQGNVLNLWLNRNAQAVNQWVTAVLSGPGGASAPSESQPANPSASPGSLFRGNVFSQTALYSATSAPTYFRYDESTGNFSEDQKGIIFRPDGTYYLRAEFGNMIQEERGRYAVSGSQVQLVFSDGSSLVLTIVDSGRRLHWYSNGMLLAEFFFLGTVR